ncbi:uncharacterized protein LOC119079335 isoform X2 [Bradysia coprophila]|uniref:uncharacterized protein LOC119079335 isoform X2 n=1 Tax=Bradysia coprophila TaxID=38358 RepID=UPI00187DCAF9|nr:uncharacterized protein LOC119079335 isoform X2 [Bradysia coprophila]
MVAGEAFAYRKKTYGMPQNGIKFKDHRRILKTFGNFVTTVTCITNFSDIGLNTRQMISAFKWLEVYCAESLKHINIIGMEKIDLPPSAIRLMPKLQRIDFSMPISDRMLRKALWNCNELVELNLMMYEGPFHLQDHRFPQLEKLSNRVRLNRDTDFNKIETFFRHHTKLTSLSTQFLINYHGDRAIDFAFLKHLPDLKKLSLILVGEPIVGTEAFAYLKNLQEFSVDSSRDKRTDALILENLASVDSLVKLVLELPEVGHLVAGIGRFKKLSKLEISSNGVYPHGTFDNANISSLSQLRDSTLTELEIGCIKLLEPESIVNVVRNLNKLKILKLYCETELSETICLRLANVCSSQRRKLIIILEKEVVDDMNFDFDYIGTFNKNHGSFVEVKIDTCPLKLND